MLIPADPNIIQGGARLAILGGCGGIGRALVDAALARDLQIAVLDLNISLEQYPLAESVKTIAVDATDKDSMASAFATLEADWGRLDGFVNLCGFMHDNQSAAEINDSTWHDILQGNLNSVFYAAKLAIPLLQKGTGGSLVNAASGLAHYIRPGFGAYSAAKAGVISLSKTLALENAPDVRVNAIAPSAVDTAFLRGGTGRSSENEAAHIDIDAYSKAIPLQRIAVPEDIVGPILFLLSEQSRYMTGQVLWINGGSYMP